MRKVSIPNISDKEMLKRYRNIKPVITKNGKLYHLREYTLDEIKCRSYTWYVDEDMREEVGEDELVALQGKDFVCLHRYGYYGFFKPKIGEVLAQIKEADVPFVRAFEIIKIPKTIEEIYKDRLTNIAFYSGYHVSIVRLYGEKS